MRNDRIHGVFSALIAMAIVGVTYGQQSTPPPATDFAPAAPGATSASPTTDPAAPAAGVTSGAGAAAGALDDRPNEQSAEAASPASTTPTSSGTFPAPAARPASPLDDQLGSGVDRRSSGVGEAAGQRGELGVWLVESGGPGVQVRRITEGSAADLAGLQSGDVILGINGRGANSPHTIAQMIRQIPAGQTANVQFWRNGQTNELEIVLQPAREPHAVAFRGDDAMGSMSRGSGDLESRVMRLEQQIAMLVQELRQLRGSGHSSTGIGGGGIGETPATGLDATSATDTTTTGTSTTQPGATPPSSTPPQSDPFDSTTAPAATPSTTEPVPATEPAASDDELFDAGSATEEPATTPTDTTTEGAAPAETPAEEEAASETEPAESASDDLFE
jgi:hypothetical protein